MIFLRYFVESCLSTVNECHISTECDLYSKIKKMVKHELIKSMTCDLPKEKSTIEFNDKRHVQQLRPN